MDKYQELVEIQQQIKHEQAFNELSTSELTKLQEVHRDNLSFYFIKLKHFYLWTNPLIFEASSSTVAIQDIPKKPKNSCHIPFLSRIIQTFQTNIELLSSCVQRFHQVFSLSEFHFLCSSTIPSLFYFFVTDEFILSFIHFIKTISLLDQKFYSIFSRYLFLHISIIKFFKKISKSCFRLSNVSDMSSASEFASSFVESFKSYIHIFPSFVFELSFNDFIEFVFQNPYLYGLTSLNEPIKQEFSPQIVSMIILQLNHFCSFFHTFGNLDINFEPNFCVLSQKDIFTLKSLFQLQSQIECEDFSIPETKDPICLAFFLPIQTVFQNISTLSSILSSSFDELFHQILVLLPDFPADFKIKNFNLIDVFSYFLRYVDPDQRDTLQMKIVSFEKLSNSNFLRTQSKQDISSFLNSLSTFEKSAILVESYSHVLDQLFVRAQTAITYSIFNNWRTDQFSNTNVLSNQTLFAEFFLCVKSDFQHYFEKHSNLSFDSSRILLSFIGTIFTYSHFRTIKLELNSFDKQFSSSKMVDVVDKLNTAFIKSIFSFPSLVEKAQKYLQLCYQANDVMEKIEYMMKFDHEVILLADSFFHEIAGEDNYQPLRLYFILLNVPDHFFSQLGYILILLYPVSSESFQGNVFNIAYSVVCFLQNHFQDEILLFQSMIS